MAILFIKDVLVDLFKDAGIVAFGMAIMAKGINVLIGAFTRGRIDV